ncbi:MAG: hypothetical protein HY039_05240 [Nitrospirae bacterium]|nr:hypothetical protein [Nitrospirota bacterium]
MPDSSLAPTERIERAIMLIRGERVMLDAHLAELYQDAEKVHPWLFQPRLARSEFAQVFQIA